MKRKISQGILGLIAAAFCWIGCASSNRDDIAVNDGRVVIRERASWLPHGTGSRTLEASGRSFRNVYSASYIWIPEWSSILFLTHRDGGARTLHVFSLEKKVDIKIKTDGLRFNGGDIGQPKTNLMTCFVERVDGDIAVLVERAFMAPERRYTLDRAKKTLSPMR